MTQPDSRSLRCIADVLKTQAEMIPDNLALTDTDGAALSYGALFEETERLAGTLAAEAPKRHDDTPTRFGIALPNGLDVAIILLAATRCGVAVPFNPAQTAVEFEAQFEATAVDCIIVPDEETSPAIDAARALGIPVLRLGPERYLDTMKGASARPPHPSADDIALILMTSGSTGKPKIVPLSHRNLCRSAYDVAQSLDLGESDRCLVMWEQFHIGGLVDLLLAPLVSGGSVIAAGSFNAERFFELQARHRATWFQGVPTSLGALLPLAQQHGITGPLPNLRFLRSVAAALPTALLQKLVAQFQVPVVRTLGMTEAAPLISTTPLCIEDAKPGSVGRSAGPEVTVLSDTGDAMPVGATGQVAIRGENVFAGYEGDPEANAAAFLDGWFLTGDLGYLDAEGDLFLTGRAKEMVNRGGEKISPNEVDDALMAHPAVREAASFAVPHGTLGEDIACAIATTGGQTPDLDALRRFLATRLAKHKIPARIDVLPDLPRNPVGKIDKQALMHRKPPRKTADTDQAALTPMQLLVRDIWMRELSLVQVDLDDDFASVDGDSLSAVRILIELENRFGVPVPNEIVENFATIRGIAEGLEAHGLDAATMAASPTEQSSQRQSLLEEQIIFSGDAQEARALIMSASSRTDLKLKLDYIVSHLEPAKVVRILDVLDDVTAGQTSEGMTTLEKLMVKREFSTRVGRLKRFLPRDPASDRWQRKHLAQGALLYSDPDRPATEKSLIVGFSGNRMRLLMPAFRFLYDVDPATSDVLLLIDHTKQLFFNGLAEYGTNTAAIGNQLSQFCAQKGYQRLIGVGTSGGSLAVLHAGITGNFDVVVSVSPASIAKHPEWTPLFEELTAQHDPDKVQVRVIHGRRERHQSSADEIMHHLPLAEQIRYPQAGKNIFPDAQDRGELGACLRRWFA